MIIYDKIPLSQTEYFDLYNDIQSITDENLREKVMRLYNSWQSRSLNEALNAKAQVIRELKNELAVTHRKADALQRKVDQYDKDFGEIDSETKRTADRILEILEKRDQGHSFWNRVQRFLDIKSRK